MLDPGVGTKGVNTEEDRGEMMQSFFSNKGGAQGTLAVIAVICIAVAAYFIFRQAKPQKDTGFGDIYFYCTNCQREFTEASNKFPPINCPFCKQPTGVVARKFECNGCGRKFIGYIQMYDPETKVLIERRQAGEKVPDEQLRSIMVTEPGSEDWIDSSTPEGADLMNNVRCPACGGTDLNAIFPKPEK
jgi:hypothetical protein